MVSAVIVAGGRGSRMGQPINKQFIKIGNREVLARTIKEFQNMDEIAQIIVVCAKDEIYYCTENIIVKYGFNKTVKVVSGGESRQESVFNGLNGCSSDTDIVVIHDGARPFVTDEIIRESIKCAREYGACTAAIPVKDTIKRVGEDKYSIETPAREGLYAIQTPQTFKYNLIMEAHRQARDKMLSATDDTALAENMGIRVKIIDGSSTNIKITTKEDLIFANAILKNKGE